MEFVHAARGQVRCQPGQDGGRQVIHMNKAEARRTATDQGQDAAPGRPEQGADLLVAGSVYRRGPEHRPAHGTGSLGQGLLCPVFAGGIPGQVRFPGGQGRNEQKTRRFGPLQDRFNEIDHAMDVGLGEPLRGIAPDHAGAVDDRGRIPDQFPQGGGIIEVAVDPYCIFLRIFGVPGQCAYLPAGVRQPLQECLAYETRSTGQSNRSWHGDVRRYRTAPTAD